MNWEKIDEISNYFIIFGFTYLLFDMGFIAYKKREFLWKMIRKAKKN